MIDNFPTIGLFVTKLGWLMSYIGVHDILRSKIMQVGQLVKWVQMWKFTYKTL